MEPLTQKEITDTARKCEGCGEFYSEQDWEDNGMYGSLSETPICFSCYNSDLENPSTLIRFNPDGEHYRAIFGDFNIYHGTLRELYDSDTPDWFAEIMPEHWSGRIWHSSSAWRGYFATDEVFQLAKIEDGWMTGDYGDVPWKKDAHSFLEALESGQITAPVPIYVLFEPTSNVFSTATTVLSKPSDAQVVKEWLAGSEYDLHKALS